MKSVKEIKSIIYENRKRLETQYHISKIDIFGSFVRGEQKAGSDIDILVEFAKPVDFFIFLDLENDLKTLLDNKVDLVSKKALKPIIGQYILREAAMIW
ncbi:nucleotidyltransferase family protein [Spirochaetota bacterium]